MAVNFPASPSVNDEYTEAGQTWICVAVTPNVWNLTSSPAITVKDAGATVGTQPAINFIEGSNITLTITNDPTNQEVDVEIAASGGGATPGTPANAVQFNSDPAGTFTGSAAFLWDDTTYTMSLGGELGGFPAQATIETLGADLILQGRNTTGENAPGITFQGGNTDDSTGGGVNLLAGYSDTGNGGDAFMQAGGSDTGTPGSAYVSAGEVDTEGPGGSVEITATSGVADSNPDQNGGNVTITIGLATGAGTPGQLIVVNLPTSDPSISGALWVDGSNFLKVSP